MSEAVRDELIESNPAFGVCYGKLAERDNRVLTPTEALRLLNPNDSVEAIWLVACHTGLRRGELCAMRWENLHDDTYDVTSALSATRDGLIEDQPKTDVSKSRIPLTPAALEAILSQPRLGDFIFSQPDGKPIHPNTLSKKWAAWRDAKGLHPNIRLQDLRGSFVSLLLENGVDLRTVQDLVRHADPRTTLRAYARSRMQPKQQGIARLSDIIGNNDKSQRANESA